MRALAHFLLTTVVGLLAAAAPESSHAQASGADTQELANPLAVHSLDRLPDTRERPLFSPMRRPPPLPPPAAQAAEIPPPPPPAPPDLALLGIVIDGDDARAVIRAGASDKTVRARIGDEISGWRITQIDGRRIVLSLGERSATFTMFSRGDAGRGAQTSGEAQPERRERAQPSRGATDSPGQPAVGRKHRRGRS